jgi:hypothetical protein
MNTFTVGFPTNMVVIIILTLILLTFLVWMGFSEMLRRIDIPASTRRFWRWGMALVLGAWLLIRLALSVNASSNNTLIESYIPETLIFLALISVLPLFIAPAFRQVIRTVPLTWLVGINILRVVAIDFLALLDMKRLPAEFALPAGYGDIAAGMLALLAVYMLATKNPRARLFAGIATVWGIVDFVTAFTTGNLFIPPFVIQLNAAGISPLYLNAVLLIPYFGVPLLLSLHIYSLIRLFTPFAAPTLVTGKPHTEAG